MKRFFSVVGKGVLAVGRGLGVAGRATIALIGICTVGIAFANYTMTQGTGTNFGSIVVSTVHYAQQLLCDPTTPSQCQAVSAGGAAKVDGSSVTQPVSVASGVVASGAYAPGAFQAGAGVDGWDSTQGAKADAACGTDNGTCSVAALLKRNNQNITTLNTTAGNPINLEALSSEPTKATTGNPIQSYADLVGKQVTSPYANRENFLNCAVTLTASTSATTCTGMGAQGASVKIYVTDLACTRNDAGTTAATMTLNDTATTIIDMPNNGGGGGFSNHYNVPLQVAANTAFTVQSGASLSSVHCSASGFKGY